MDLHRKPRRALNRPRAARTGGTFSSPIITRSSAENKVPVGVWSGSDLRSKLLEAGLNHF